MSEVQRLISEVEALTYALQNLNPPVKIPPICPLCKGQKNFITPFFDDKTGEHFKHAISCPTCSGRGFIK